MAQPLSFSFESNDSGVLDFLEGHAGLRGLAHQLNLSRARAQDGPTGSFTSTPRTSGQALDVSSCAIIETPRHAAVGISDWQGRSLYVRFLG
jgi:hypothetical protein